MRPATDKLLHSVYYTFEQALMPNIAGEYQKSLSLTSCNILRYVQQLVANEGRLQFEDNQQLRLLLVQIRDYLATLPDIAEDGELAKQLELALQFEIKGYCGTDELNEQSFLLKTALESALEKLIAFPAPEKEDAEYQKVREEICDYLRENIRREAELVDAAFISQRR